MELQSMILVPPELRENRSQAPPPPVKKILNSKDHSYNKWTQVRLHQDPYLKTEKRKWEPIVIRIVETGGTPESSFKTKSRRKGSVPLSESENDDASPVLKRKIFHDSAFGVYRDDTDGSLKIGCSKFKYNDTHVFVDGIKYKATSGLWELLTKLLPDITMVALQDRQAYKQILIQSNAHRVNYSPSGKIKANKGLKYTQFISRLFCPVPWVF
jgi:hypothetical protein